MTWDEAVKEDQTVKAKKCELHDFKNILNDTHTETVFDAWVDWDLICPDLQHGPDIFLSGHYTLLNY